MRVRSLSELPSAMRDQVVAQVGSADRLLREARKYHNTPVTVEGMRFDSRLEWRCYEWLKVRATEGEVLWFTRQCPFQLEGGVVYRCDFLVALAAGGVEAIDAKGRDTQVSRNKRRQVKARYGVDVQLWPSR